MKITNGQLYKCCFNITTLLYTHISYVDVDTTVYTFQNNILHLFQFLLLIMLNSTARTHTIFDIISLKRQIFLIQI